MRKLKPKSKAESAPEHKLKRHCMPKPEPEHKHKPTRAVKAQPSVSTVMQAANAEGKMAIVGDPEGPDGGEERVQVAVVHGASDDAARGKEGLKEAVGAGVVGHGHHEVAQSDQGQGVQGPGAVEADEACQVERAKHDVAAATQQSVEQNEEGNTWWSEEVAEAEVGSIEGQGEMVPVPGLELEGKKKKKKKKRTFGVRTSGSVLKGEAS